MSQLFVKRIFSRNASNTYYDPLTSTDLPSYLEINNSADEIYPHFKNKLKSLNPRSDEIRDEGLVNDGVFKMIEHYNSLLEVIFPVRKDFSLYEIYKRFKSNGGFSMCYPTWGGNGAQEDIFLSQLITALIDQSAYRQNCIGVGVLGSYGSLKTNAKGHGIQYLFEKFNYIFNNYNHYSTNGYLKPDVTSSQREIKITRSYIEIPSKESSPSWSTTVPFQDSDNNNISYHAVYLALQNILNSKEVLNKCSLSPGLKGKTFIMKGMDKLGAHLAKLLVKKGALCVGVKDKDVYVYDPLGIDLEGIYDCKCKYGTLICYNGAVPECFGLMCGDPCDMLIDTDNQSDICSYVTDNLNPKIIVEAGNIVKPARPKIYVNQLIVPNIYAFPNICVKSYTEYLWHLQQLGKLDGRILRITQEVFAKGLQKSLFEVEEDINNSFSSISASVIPSIINRSAIFETLERILAGPEQKLYTYSKCLELNTEATLLLGINILFKSLYHPKKLFEENNLVSKF